jgi:hypothetical protein
MADKRISQLIERTDIANNDVLPIVASGATTTNKVTISTIQDWMQDNLDVGVTSVGITLGTTGTDVNVSGSPITTSGNITINIPDASATARGVVTTGSQVFGGVKTFANGLSLPSAGGSNQVTRIVNIGTLHEGSANLNQIGFNSANNIYFGKGLSNGGVLQWNNSAVRYYTFPDADGTLALASDLTGYVTLGTAQTITAQKTFSTSGSSDTAIINHGSGSGIALNITKGGNGEGLRVTKTSGSGNAVTITGGTLSAEAGQFSGDLQTSTRISATSGSNAITITPNVGGTQNRIETTGSLPLSLVSAAAITMAAGGTTPQITLTTAGNVAIGTGSVTGAINADSFRSNLILGAANSNKISFNNGSTTETGFIYNDSSETSIGYPSSGSFAVQRVGVGSVFTIASTGAATFSSSVTASGGKSQFVASGGASAGAGISLNNGLSGSGRRNWFIGTEESVEGDFQIKCSTAAGGVGGSGDTRLAILNNGNVGIGTASPTNGLLVINSTASNGVRFALESSGTMNGVVAIGNNAISGLSTTDMALWTRGVMAFETGASGEKMRITSDGYLRMASGTGGIQFNGDTAAANALDDYEEGTWTPEFIGGGGTATYNSRRGWYTKIGRQVTIVWEVSFQKNTISSTMGMSGLPFTVLADSSAFYPQGTVLLDNLSTTTNNITFQVANGSTQGDFIGGNGGTTSHTGLPASSLGSGTMMCRGSATYYV